MTPASRFTISGGPAHAVGEKAAATVDKHSMFTGGATLVVAVSGGPDSTCLLDVLQRFRPEVHLVVAHVDHGLSEGSEAIAADVARRAAADGHDVHVARATGLEGPNLHARARDFRYSFFETIARDEEASAIATGHTLDDRVETTLARLIHGAGTEVLAGIAPVTSGRPRRVRPLLGLRRAETRAYCDELGLAYVDDAANRDPRFERASVRETVLRPIEERWGDGAIRAMAASSERLREDAQALLVQAAALYSGLAVESGPGIVSLDLSTVMALPRALRRRILELAIGRVRDRAAAIEEVLDALERDDRKPDAAFDVAAGGKITIGSEAIRVQRPRPSPAG